MRIERISRLIDSKVFLSLCRECLMDNQDHLRHPFENNLDGHILAPSLSAERSSSIDSPNIADWTYSEVNAYLRDNSPFPRQFLIYDP
jgi:hypothetical protein